MECRQIAELLGDYFDGSLPSHLRDLLEWHIEGCQPCVAFINTYRGTIAATRRLHDAPMPVELKKRLLARVAQETEAGDVRRTRRAGIPRDARRDAIEPQHALDRGRHGLVWCGAVLRGRGDDAGAEPLGEEQPIAGAQTALDEHAVGMD